MKKLVLSLLVGASGFVTYAGGFQVVLQGVRQTSMGNVATAVPDAASIFFNPGAVAMLEGNVVSAGVSPIISRISYLESAPYYTEAKTNNPMSLPFYLYAAFGFGPQNANGVKRLKAGLGVFTPFGSSIKWEDGWSKQTYLRSLSLRAIYIQPTVSFMVNDYVGIGAGLDVVLGSVNLTRGIADPTTGNFAEVKFNGKAQTAFGYNVGFFVKSPEGVSFGINYRSKVTADIKEGDVTFDLTGTSQTFQNQAQLQDTKFSSSLPLPGVITVGFAYSNDKFTIASDIRFTQWSAYEELKFVFKDTIGGVTESVSKRRYQDAIVIGLGGEYNITDALKARLGAYYDITPVPYGYMTPETPDANSLGLSAGLGYSLGNLNINAGFLFVNKEKRSQYAASDANSISGTFKTQAYIPSFGVSYNF